MDAPRPARRTSSPARTKGWVVGRISGAPVIVAPSWFLAAAVLTILFAPTVQRLSPQLDRGIYLVSFAFVLLLFVSVFLHEVAHALVARARGHKVTELAVTLWGGHTAYSGSSSRPLDGLLVAVVGPITNLALAVVFWLGSQQVHDAASVPAILMYAAAFSNAFVGVFNLLPGLPLDGGQILESIVWAATGSRTRGTIAAGWVGRVVAVGVVAWVLLVPPFSGRSPDLVTVAWAGLIGAFLWSGAGAAMHAGRSREAVAALSVPDLMRPAVTVTFDASVADAGRVVGEAGGPHVVAVVVDDEGGAVGYVDASAAQAVPAAEAATTAIVSVTVPLPPEAIDIDLSGQAMIVTLARIGSDAPFVAVARDGQVCGVLELRTVAASLHGAHRRGTGSGSAGRQ